MTAPKLFVSYSWSNPEHEQWVLNIATELRQSEVDAMLDKWDLREGQDTIAFMEQMVTNPEIKKVVMICDRKYAQKADSRVGGVGTETQIVSKEVYDSQDQNKFVALVTEKDENGKPFLPTYYKSRLYIDFSDSDRYADSFEQLLRWIFDKPIYVKPELGKKPTFLEEGEHIYLGTTAAFNRCIDAIKNHKPNALGAYDEYCDIFVTNLERFRISRSIEGEFDDLVVQSIDEFIPYRNEVIQVFMALAKYSPSQDFIKRTHRLFENLIPYMHRPESVNQWNEWDFDNFKFFINELFIYALAVFIKSDRLQIAAHLLEQQYYAENIFNQSQCVMFNYYELFNLPVRSLYHRKDRLQLNGRSLMADMLKQRSNNTGINFRYLVQADFVAFIRSEVEAKNNYFSWHPETLYSHDRHGSAFEIFARSVSKEYFNRVKSLLSIHDKKDLEPLLLSYQDGTRKLPSLGFSRINPAILMGFDELDTRA